jgi:predicted nuclease of predicted toxin-antitoxin system
LLVDAQLPPTLARRMEAFGHVAEHVADCGLESAADHDIRACAAKVGAVIITKDEDFVVRKMLESGPAVVWVRIREHAPSRAASPSRDTFSVDPQRA